MTALGGRRKRSVELATVAAAVLALIVLVFPFAWIVLTSLRPEGDLFTSELSLWPAEPTLRSYRLLFTSEFAGFMINSIRVTVPTVLLSVTVALPAAYSFSRRQFRGRHVLLLLVVLTQLFPFIALVTPLYSIFVNLGLLNSHLGIVIAYVAITTPLCVYMLLGFLESIPRELDEAAVIDGCSTIGVIRRVILPVAWPGVVAVAIFAFILAWNEFLLALTFLTRDEVKTIPVGLAAFFGEFGARWDLVMAASVIATLPTLIIFFSLQRQLVANLTAGAVK